MQQAAVALGSNLGDRLATLRSAVQALGGVGALTARSALYETAPVGPPQPDYLNAVVLLDTALEPLALLDALLDIERRHGRVRGQARWGPRTLDLDLLALGDRVVRSDRLVLPHPELAVRAFVLRPLADVAAGLVLPGHTHSVAELWQARPDDERAGVRPFLSHW